MAAALLFVLAAPTARADTLVMKGKESNGKFEGFQEDRFLFRGDGGAVRQHRAAVDSLVLDAPCTITLVKSTGGAAEPAKLFGYGHSAFAVEQNGARREIPGMLVRRIEVLASEEAGHAGGGGLGPAHPRPYVDVSGVNAADLTPAQRTALERYKTASDRFDAFVSENAAMVAEMDRSSGARREELIGTLRVRRSKEEPLRQELNQAADALQAALPRTPPPRSEAHPKDKGAAGKAGAESPMPTLAKGEVMLIDTSDLEKLRHTDQVQSLSLSRYKNASRRYLQVNAAGSDAERAAAAKEVQAAQRALFQAFPGLKLAGEGK